MIKIPNNIAALKPYKPGKANNEVLQSEDGQHLSVLCSNENNFGPSPKAKQAIINALDDLYLYPDPTGMALKEKLSTHLNVSTDKLILGNGSDGILYTIFKAFFDEGQSILTSKATFVSLHAMAQMHRIPLLTVPMKTGYQFDLDAIFENIHSHTKVIYLCNPNNPTGTVIPEKDLIEFIKKVPEHILVIVDEAYFEFAQTLSDDYTDTSRLNFKNVLSLRTFSKAYGLAGIRLGYGIGSPEIISTLHKVKLTFNPNNLAQAAGRAALDDQAHLDLTISNNKKWMQSFYEAITNKGLDYYKSAANFVMIDLHEEAEAIRFNDFMKKNNVLVRHLSSFGLPTCVRVSIGTPKDNVQFVEKLKLY